jgi:hypothetical protein
VPEEIRKELAFVFAERVEDVWKESLIPILVARDKGRKYDDAEFQAERQAELKSRREERPEQR